MLRSSPLATAFVLSLLLSSPGCGHPSSESEPVVFSADGPEIPLLVVPPPPPGCSGKHLPTDATCTIHEAYGVFVGRHGKDTNQGTRREPVRTLATAIRFAMLTRRRVYVCAETFDEALLIEDGVSMFGYFDCQSDWAVSSRRARVAPRMHEVAARTRGIVRPTRIESFEIVSPDAAPSRSSMGLVAERALALSFHRTLIRAGRGGDGENGIEPTALQNDPSADGAPGEPMQIGPCEGSCRLAHHQHPTGGTNACGAANVVTGRGGAGGRAGRVRYRPHRPGDLPLCYPAITGRDFTACYYPEPGEPFDEGEAVEGARGAGFGYSELVGDVLEVTTVLAKPGEVGRRGRAGENGRMGTFDANGYRGGDGTQGENGAPGKGGGGGSAQVPQELLTIASYPLVSIYAWMGGGGGAGGCPGLAGSPGKGGGASVAVISIDSMIAFDATSSLEASAGGLGGAGTFGSNPSDGGLGKGSAREIPETQGARGGRGGDAGASGHGASGPTIGIAWRGQKPTRLPTTILAKPAGPQPERSNGRALIPAGMAGVAREELELL